MSTLPNAFPNGTNETVKIHDSNNSIARCGDKGIWAILILDESGSMGSSRNDTIGGVNTYLRNLDQNTSYASIYKFASLNNLLHDHVAVSEIPDLTPKDYNPGGGTALNDAVGECINTVNAKLKSLDEKDRPTVVFCIVTDGEDNQSNLFSKEEIKNMVSNARDSYWGFTFLGADIDAFSAASSYGVSMNASANFDRTKISETFRSASNYTRSYNDAIVAGTAAGLVGDNLTASLSTVSYSDAERKSMEDK